MVFYLELIISVTLENRDRLAPYWNTVRAHMYSILSDYRSAFCACLWTCPEATLGRLQEEPVFGGAGRGGDAPPRQPPPLPGRNRGRGASAFPFPLPLSHGPTGSQVLQSLALLQLLRPPTLRRLSLQIAAGLHQLLRANAANIHKRAHWAILFE